MYFSICPKSNAPRNLTGPLTPYAGQTGLYFPPQVWTREQKRAVASAWLVEVRNNVDGYSPSTAHCTDVGAPCGLVTNIDSQVTFGKWEETGPGGLVDADILEVCQFSASRCRRAPRATPTFHALPHLPSDRRHHQPPRAHHERGPHALLHLGHPAFAAHHLL